jgi:glyoxylase-like metal-dependent hydrolase (beta-lactamase superfamily II)
VVHSHEENGAKGIDHTYFLVGDATYGIDLLEKEQPDGINDDPMRALQTLKIIKQFAREREVIVLPSHDIDTPRLLAEKIVYSPSSS